MALVPRTIVGIDRLDNSANGNPRFRFHFEDEPSATLQSDAAFGYEVENPGFRVGDTVMVKFSRGGRVEFMKRAIFVVGFITDERSSGGFEWDEQRARIETARAQWLGEDDCAASEIRTIERPPGDDPQAITEELDASPELWEPTPAEQEARR